MEVAGTIDGDNVRGVKKTAVMEFYIWKWGSADGVRPSACIDRAQPDWQGKETKQEEAVATGRGLPVMWCSSDAGIPRRPMSAWRTRRAKIGLALARRRLEV